MTATVLFCDLCNESVPQPDLDEGRATLVNGRVVCATCERLMSGAEAPAGTSAPAAGAPETGAGPAAAVPRPAGEAAAPAIRHRRPRSGAGAAGLAGVGVLLALGIGWALSNRIEEMQTRYDQSLLKAVRDYREAAAQVRREARERDAGVQAVLASVGTELDRYGSDLDGAQRRWTRESELVMTELRDFDVELDRVKELTGLIQRHDKEMVGLQAKFAGVVDDLARQGERLTELEERPVVAIAEPAGDPAGAGGNGDAGGDQPGWGHLLTGLSSPNADERWMAVDELGQTGDPAVADYLVPMLKDDDTFVRMATARILGELEAPVGIPPLIDALEDDEPAVREAAMVALQSMTGRDFKFDPHAAPADRAKRVKAWRDWWAKNRDDYPG